MSTDMTKPLKNRWVIFDLFTGDLSLGIVEWQLPFFMLSWALLMIPDYQSNEVQSNAE